MLSSKSEFENNAKCVVIHENNGEKNLFILKA